MIPGSGGEVGVLTGVLDNEGIGIWGGWYMPDMLEPSPPSGVKFCAVLSHWGLLQNFIAFRT